MAGMTRNTCRRAGATDGDRQNADLIGRSQHELRIRRWMLVRHLDAGPAKTRTFGASASRTTAAAYPRHTLSVPGTFHPNI